MTCTQKISAEQSIVDREACTDHRQWFVIVVHYLGEIAGARSAARPLAVY